MSEFFDIIVLFCATHNVVLHYFLIATYLLGYVKYANTLISEAIFGADDFPGDYRIWLER